ncbi:ATP-binding protein [Pelagicoccus sp. SDUM812003]|uniref:hybrid sensor histidine kinase/response regulator n=1 Tax=Pelagicoccus sp. SDUM812003 TaxID=3041267 RepID=UPI00280D0B17|nr:ATP-binding protein [Pelagicoccus sp. SDUM812003]MDQ8202293.1 ATP-binding protein [Pelagicoccus sp. SDUM812003]
MDSIGINTLSHQDLHDVTDTPVLVVDDDPVVHLMVKTILQKLGYRYFGASSAIEALDMIRDVQPELVMSDVSMPEINGMEFCIRLKADEELKDIPVIFFTAHSDPELLGKAFDAGACDFLIKPLQPFEIASRAQHHIVQYRLRREDRNVIHTLDTRNQTMTKFLGVASHDLRNPLVSIRGLSKQLKSEIFGKLNETQNELIEAINQSSDAMLTLVEELMEVSKFKSSLNRINRVEEEIGPLLQLARALHSGSANLKQIEIKAEECPPELRAPVDKKLLTRVIDNLITNAVKFSPSGTAVTITAADETDHIRISVSDQGPGIPVDEFAQLFKEFSKTSNQTTAGESSHGLGLYVCRCIVEAHHGAISARNLPEGGACFSFTLPKHATDE